MATNAVSDSLFYSIGGGSVISQPASLNRMQRLGVSAGINSDLMCGNFDIKTTVGNQLNGLTSGFKDLMGEVMQGATGAVSSLPGMIIQRANPGLYDMITNGILQAGFLSISPNSAVKLCPKNWPITPWVTVPGQSQPSGTSTVMR